MYAKCFYTCLKGPFDIHFGWHAGSSLLLTGILLDKLVCIFVKHLIPVPECKVEFLFLEYKYLMAHAAAGFLPE